MTFSGTGGDTGACGDRGSGSELSSPGIGARLSDCTARASEKEQWGSEGAGICSVVGILGLEPGKLGERGPGSPKPRGHGCMWVSEALPP